MADRPPPDVTKRTREGIHAFKPRWGWFKGVLTGVAIEIPALTAAVWLLARLGIGNADASFTEMLQLATKFAGVAALLTAGGIGRLAADASMDGGRRRGVWVAARAHAVASAGLVVIAALPNGHLPEGSDWVMVLFLGALVGAACGALIGLVCGGAAPVDLGDVWQLARAPTDALRNLLGAEQLVRLGSAVRSRTSHLFEGIFEPQEPRPDGSMKLDAAPPEVAKIDEPPDESDAAAKEPKEPT